MNESCFLLLIAMFHSLQAVTAVDKKLTTIRGKDGTVDIYSNVGSITIIVQQGKGHRFIFNGRYPFCKGKRCITKLGGLRNPAQSCKEILNTDRSTPSGAYYIKTGETISKVYCYMENIPGCGGGGWTTIMKTDGHKSTFDYASALWQNKVPYHVTGGQSGVDHQETKLPTYWTMPFTSLCLGLKTKAQAKPNWIYLNYKASSLYSVIADGRYRSFSRGRNAWKSLIQGSSLQRNCNKEGFNIGAVRKGFVRVRIGIISNNENDCLTPDSLIGFGSASSVTTGNKACCGGDNGDKTTRTQGYILAQ